MRIAFVTCQQYPTLSASDQLCAASLATQNCLVEAALWQDKQVNWQAFDLVVLRSCWDYYQRIDSFRAFISRLRSLQVPLYNPAAMVAWNLHKQYLFDLSRGGLSLPATIVLRQGEFVEDVSTLLQRNGWPSDWQRFVIKPCVSASGANVELIARNRQAQGSLVLNQLLSKADVLLQQYVPEVATQGEHAYVFFEGVFSHAVLKKVGLRASPGEFRINSAYGGVSEHSPEDPIMLDGARRTVELIATLFGQLPLYARIDAVKSRNQFVLMEAELIEPGLFFASFNQGAVNFASAILRKVQSSRR